MGAQILVKIDETRLVEIADQMRNGENRALDCERIARVGAQVPAPEVMGREKRRASRKIEDDITGRIRTIPRRTEH